VPLRLLLALLPRRFLFHSTSSLAARHLGILLNHLALLRDPHIITTIIIMGIILTHLALLQDLRTIMAIMDIMDIIILDQMGHASKNTLECFVMAVDRMNR
jgi:hypothetical protein